MCGKISERQRTNAAQMPTIQRSYLFRALCLLALAVAMLAGPSRPASAQVAAIVNGDPITALDIAERMKLHRSSGKPNISRREVLEELIEYNLVGRPAREYRPHRGGSEPRIRRHGAALGPLARSVRAGSAGRRRQTDPLEGPHRGRPRLAGICAAEFRKRDRARRRPRRGDGGTRPEYAPEVGAIHDAAGDLRRSPRRARRGKAGAAEGSRKPARSPLLVQSGGDARARIS